MTLFTLAVKNVVHHRRNYVAFFLSTVMAVWLFFTYASLLRHPQFESTPGPVEWGMTVLQYMVSLLSVVFLLQAHGAFLRARQRDLGVMTVVGMEPGQIARTIHWENAIVGVGAITLGVGLGRSFLKVVYLTLSWVLGLPEPVPFHFSPRALGATYFVFAGIFTVISVYDQFVLRRKTVIELIRGSVKPKGPPRLSIWRAALSMAGLAAGYGLILTVTTPITFQDRFLWVVLSLLVGTYFLLTQVTTAILRLLQRSRPLYHRGANLLIITQLIAKARGNARTLFLVSMVATVILFVFGVVSTLFSTAVQQVLKSDPVSLLVVGEPSGVGPDRITTVLRSHRLAVEKEVHLPALVGQTDALGGVDPWESEAPPVLLIPASGLNRWLDLTGQKPVSVPDGLGLVVHRWSEGPWERQGTIVVGDQSVSLPMRGAQSEGVRLETFNAYDKTRVVATLDDPTFEALYASASQKYRTSIHGYQLPQWLRSSPAITKLEEAMGMNVPGIKLLWGWEGPISSSIRAYEMAKQLGSFLLFMAAFVGVLFSLAAGNMLYFKLFTDLGQDRQHFQALFKLGLSAEEVRRVISVETFILFFFPVVVGAAHAAAFTSAQSRLIGVSPWNSVGFVTAAYLCLQGGYWLATRHYYSKAVLAGQ